ncbi:response regulator [Candidatus Magnetominusculus dajiuhuensis]|uniref:response regulator n=1 Tax=Candidatus Magnetominusculus dajiuhuensis TaxID=3137712 RepID=UPI003B4358B8
MRSENTWNLLIVDDEEDIHGITRISLKRKQYRDRSLNMIHAYSAKEAIKVLSENDKDFFDVALIDVVMEEDTAGLGLCKYIRENYPVSFRLILRTGQAGKAPEEQVMNTYDIDHYLAKTEATPERIFGLIRSCLRVSEEIQTVLALTSQIQSFSGKILADSGNFDTFIEPIKQALVFLEKKHALNPASVLIGSFSKKDNRLERVVGNQLNGVDEASLKKIFELAVNECLQPYTFYGEFSDITLNDNEYLVILPLTNELPNEASTEDKKEYKKQIKTQNKYFSWIKQIFSSSEEVNVLSCVFIRSSDKLTQSSLDQILSDLRIYGESWKIAYLAYYKQKSIKQEEQLLAGEG